MGHIGIEQTAGRKRIRDRHIRWVETYGEKSEDVKKKFDKMLPGAYFRWEGFDYTTNHPYYVVVGPSVSRRFGKSFFAGIKKMPKERKKKAYSPSGKYFPSLMGALRHASEFWGVTIPKTAQNYQKHDLVNVDIPEHIKG